MHKHKIRELNEQEAIIKATQKQYPNLTKWFDGLQINQEKALKEVQVIFPIKTSGIRGVARGKASNWAKRYRSVQVINKLSNGQFYYTEVTSKFICKFIQLLVYQYKIIIHKWESTFF